MNELNLPPLKEFDARIIQRPLQGIFRNMEFELLRRVQTANASSDVEGERRSTLFVMMLQFTKNSYGAANFLCSTEDDASNRKENFALVLPPINRQLLDLLFTLVYILDDFPTRSMDYERSGYRQAREEYDKYRKKFGSDPAWQSRFKVQEDWFPGVERYLSITKEQKANPKLIRRWLGPAKLKEKQTRSQPFMQFLDEWIYKEVSAQAHLNAAGLLSVGLFLLTDLAPEGQRVPVHRALQAYTFWHYARTLTVVLGIASEIDTFAKVGNREALVRLWVMLGDHALEAKEVYEQRYQAMLTPDHAD
ncbi:MAG TPA: hypothetical protein VFE02_16485 [Candidatus Acidoferrales bacterium]|jgi:hypothetical protein|nr:hypothetical protein [Candidatus Acidoferrales bacterium]